MSALLESAAFWTFRASLAAAAIIAAVLLLRILLGRRIAPAWWCALWLVAGLRFAVPPIAAPTAINPWYWLTASSPSQPASVDDFTPLPRNAGVRITYDPPPARHPIATIPAPRARFRWPLTLGIIWLIGAALLILRRTIRELILARQIRRFPEIQTPDLHRILRECAKQLHLRRLPRLVEAPDLRTPAVWGILRPVILLPPGFADTASHAEIRMVVLHEILHIRRLDLLIDRILHLIRDIHWFNPAAWLWLWFYGCDREFACDRAVLVHMLPHDRASYGHCLLRMVERLPNLQPAPASIGMFHIRAKLHRRIAMISNFSLGRPRVWNAVALLAVLMVGCAAVTGGSSAPSASAPKASNASQTSPTSIHNTRTDASAEKNPAAESALDRRLKAVNFDNIPLDQAIDWFRDTTKTNLIVHWSALEQAGIDKNTPVSVHLNDVEARKALQIILADVGGGAVRLGFNVDEGVITISTEEDLNRHTVTRTYDVRDILALGTLPGMPGENGMPPTPPRSKQEVVRDLINVIESSVAPDTWRDTGGTTGSIQELGGQLIIMQTDGTQREIEKLLNTLRSRIGPQITVETHCLSVDMNQLSPEAKAILQPALDHNGSFLLSYQKYQQLLRTTMNGGESTLLTGPRLTLFNGQRGYVSVARKVSYISGFTPVKSPNGEMRYEPQNTNMSEGLTLDVTATASADGQSVTLAFHPKLTRLLEMRSEPWPGAADAKDLRVQQPVLAVQEANLTFSIPNDTTAIVAASPADAETGVTTRPANTHRRLFVLVKASVIIPAQEK